MSTGTRRCFSSRLFIAILYAAIPTPGTPAWAESGDASPPPPSQATPDAARKDPAWDSTANAEWPADFQIVEIPSSLDGNQQKAYLRKARSSGPRPLVVSLHTWSGTYAQPDPLSAKVAGVDYHYIHPDFRGANQTPESCASPQALSDIDDAIDYCFANMNVDKDRIYVVGVSGGGHAACASYLTSRQKIRGFYAWVPITDLEAWYYQSKQQGRRYAALIQKVLGDSEGLSSEKAKARSPLFMPFISASGKITICAGIDDGWKGSVPISHSLLFFNRICEEKGVPEKKVSEKDCINLLSKDVRNVVGEMEGRQVYLDHDAGAARVVIFQGGHEMLVSHCLSLIEADVISNGGKNPLP